DRSVLHAVYGVLVGDRRVVDVALAALRVWVVRAADRGHYRVLDGAGLVLLVLQHLRVGLAVVLDLGDRRRPVLPGLAVLVHLIAAEPDDAQRQRADQAEQDDRTPVATLVDLDGGDRLTAATLAARLGRAWPGAFGRARARALGRGSHRGTLSPAARRGLPGTRRGLPSARPGLLDRGVLGLAARLGARRAAYPSAAVWRAHAHEEASSYRVVGKSDPGHGGVPHCDRHAGSPPGWEVYS